MDYVEYCTSILLLAHSRFVVGSVWSSVSKGVQLNAALEISLSHNIIPQQYGVVV